MKALISQLRLSPILLIGCLFVLPGTTGRAGAPSSDPIYMDASPIGAVESNSVLAGDEHGEAGAGNMSAAGETLARGRPRSDDLSQHRRQSIRRSLINDGNPTAAAVFDIEKKITASDGAVDEQFGRSVAISGDTAIVGAHQDDDNAFDSGSAYVYQRDEGGINNWGEVTKITASDGAVLERFGRSVAISGDTAIVGAHRDDDNGTVSGSAYVYQRDEGGVDNWGEVTKITASDAAVLDEFGISVAISGDTAIVGAFLDDDNGFNSGSAYVYQRDEGGANNWGELTKLTASDAAAQDLFGISVAISGDTAIVGAPQLNNGSSSGSAYVYRRDEGGLGNWGEVTKITPSDGPGAGGHQFGISVAISGDTAIVGAWFDDDNGAFSGSAYVYQRDEGGLHNWGEVTKITATDGAFADNFGVSVAISGDTAIVGAFLDDDNGVSSGSAYVYRRNEGGGDNWGEVTKITASDGAASDFFARSVAISDDTALVGAEHGACAAAINCGAAYIYFTLPFCGHGTIDTGEECDDGNSADGDGCSSTCTVEIGYTCDAGEPSVCTDDDECTLGTDNCDASATCVNTPGSFDCACDTGHFWDGVTCQLCIDPIYVDLSATGTASGNSWANAMTSLQDGLAADVTCGSSEVWVATGTYTPDQGIAQTSGDRMATFQLINGVAIFGGFPVGGGDGTFGARDIVGNETILSGDLVGDDTPLACVNDSPDCDLNGELCVEGFCIIAQNNCENSHHVVTGSGTGATAVLDGFTITEGNADVGIPDRLGAGMFNETGSPTVTNCTFSGNSASKHGGGMYNNQSSPAVTNCTFSGNAAVERNGGGMYNISTSNPTVTNCTFRGNSAGFNGGGMLNNTSSPTVTNCTFRGNTAGVQGGGMMTTSGSPTLTNCTFSGNSSGTGGGVLYRPGTWVTGVRRHG